jgi:hypothetical protein
MGLYGIIMKEDTLQIVNVVKAKHKNWSKFGHIVDVIKKTNTRIKRDTNSAAHDLAKEAIKYVIDGV